jgi:DNA-binding transcriptional MocR family regulator
MEIVSDPRFRDCPAAVRTLVHLASYANNGTKIAFPSRKRLSNELGIAERSVSRHLALLKDWGYIRPHGNPDHRFGTNAYQIQFTEADEPKGPKATPNVAPETRKDSPSGYSRSDKKEAMKQLQSLQKVIHKGGDTHVQGVTQMSRGGDTDVS